MGGPIDSVYPDGSAVAKVDVRADDKTGHRRTMASADAVRAADLTGQFGGIYVAAIKKFYDIDTENTDADDGDNVIIDFVGNHFVKLSLGVGLPAGGTTGQVLAKVDGTDFNVAWVDQSGSGSVDESADYAWTGDHSFGKGISIAPPALSTTKGISIAQSGPTSGTVTGPFIYNEIDINENTNVVGTDARSMGLYMQYNLGGSNTLGAKYGAFINMNHNADSSSGADMVAGVSQFYSSADAGSGGEGYGYNACAFAGSGSVLPALNGLEIDVGISVGANVDRRSGLRIVADNTGIGSLGLPAGEDGAIWFSSKDGGGSFKLGMNFTNYFGAQPLRTTASVIGFTGLQTVSKVLDLTNLTVSDYIILADDMSITGAGVITGTGLVSSKNAASLPAASSLLHIGAADGTEAHATIDSFGTGNFGAFSELDFRRANGTAASPSAMQDNDLIGLFGGQGYGATDYSASPRAQLRFTAVGTWTDASQGEKIAFLTTPSGGTSTAVAFEILDSGLIGFQKGLTPNGTVATAMSSLGPSGAHTTIQEWLKVKGSAGADRYIAMF